MFYKISVPRIEDLRVLLFNIGSNWGESPLKIFFGKSSYGRAYFLLTGLYGRKASWLPINYNCKKFYSVMHVHVFGFLHNIIS
jgi:hypothetical protein